MPSIYLPSTEETSLQIHLPGRDEPIECDMFDIDEAVSDAIDISKETQEKWLTELTNLLNRKWKTNLNKGQVYTIHQAVRQQIDTLKKKSLKE